MNRQFNRIKIDLTWKAARIKANILISNQSKRKKRRAFLAAAPAQTKINVSNVSTPNLKTACTQTEMLLR